MFSIQVSILSISWWVCQSMYVSTLYLSTWNVVQLNCTFWLKQPKLNCQRHPEEAFCHTTSCSSSSWTWHIITTLVQMVRYNAILVAMLESNSSCFLQWYLIGFHVIGKKTLRVENSLWRFYYPHTTGQKTMYWYNVKSSPPSSSVGRTQKIPTCFVSNISFVLAKWVVECAYRVRVRVTSIHLPPLWKHFLVQRRFFMLKMCPISRWVREHIAPLVHGLGDRWHRSLCGWRWRQVWWQTLTLTQCQSCKVKCFARSLDQFLDPLTRMRYMHAQLRITVQNFEGLQDSQVRKTEYICYERLVARFTSSFLLFINRKNRTPLVTHHTVLRYKEDRKLYALLPSSTATRSFLCVRRKFIKSTLIAIDGVRGLRMLLGLRTTVGSLDFLPLSRS